MTSSQNTNLCTQLKGVKQFNILYQNVILNVNIEKLKVHRNNICNI